MIPERLLVFGGIHEGQACNHLESLEMRGWDGIGGTKLPTTTAATPRAAAAAALQEGKEFGSMSSTTEAYDGWEWTRPLPSGRPPVSLSLPSFKIFRLCVEHVHSLYIHILLVASTHRFFNYS